MLRRSVKKIILEISERTEPSCRDVTTQIPNPAALAQTGLPSTCSPMDANSHPKYPAPRRDLSERVAALFHYVRSLETSDGNWRFHGGKRGEPTVEAVHNTFINFHSPFSRWRGGNARPADGPSFQLAFTRRLIAILQGDRKHALLAHQDNYDAIYKSWTADDWTAAKVTETSQALLEYLSQLESIQSRTMHEVDQARLLQSKLPASSYSTTGFSGVLFGQRPVTLDDFDADGADLGNTAKHYLRGAEPTFAVSNHVGVRRNDDITAISKHINDGASALQIYAPVAEGLTTVLMQTVFALLTKEPGLPIYWYSHGLLPDAPPPVSGRHVVVIDDGHDVENFPAWLRNYDRRVAQGILLLGCRELASRRLTRVGNIAWSRIRLNAVPAEDAGDYIDRIVNFKAADQPGFDLRSLFVTALGSRGHGGLFPAMFAATRGELLESRYRRIVELMETTDPKLDALACLVFCNMIHLLTNQHVGLPSRTILEVMSQEGALQTNAPNETQREIRRLPDQWEGEVRLRVQGTVELRHPSITHILFRWIFGGASAGGGVKGEVRRYKWAYYGYLATTLLALQGASSLNEVEALLEGAVSGLWYDDRRAIPLDNPAHACGLIVRVLDAIEDEYAPTGIRLGKLLLTRARLFSFLCHRSEHQETAAVNKGSALAALTRAVNANQTPAIYLQIGHVLEQLPQPAVIILSDGRNVDWQFFFNEAADQSEVNGDYRTADRSNREYLLKLAGWGRGEGARKRIHHSRGRLARILYLVRKTALLDNPAYDDVRVELLSHILRWMHYEYPAHEADPAQVMPIGSSADEFPDSRRSAYRAVWRELYRLSSTGKLQARLASKSFSGIVTRIMQLWVQDEQAEPAATAWPKPAGNVKSVADLLNANDWQALAQAYPHYFPTA